MQATPRQQVTETYTDKQTLVKAIESLTKDDLWIDRVSAKGLERISNKKLMRLHARLMELKENFSSRAKLVDAVAELQGHAKDADYKARLQEYPAPRLLDMHRALTKRQAAKGEAR